jgi:hypothetical protein
MPFISGLIRRQALGNRTMYSLILIVLAAISRLSISVLRLLAKVLTIYIKGA